MPKAAATRQYGRKAAGKAVPAPRPKPANKGKVKGKAKKAGDQEDSDNDGENDKFRADSGSGRKEQLVLSLPPMTNIEQIFSDMVSRYSDEFSAVITTLKRPLRIATMCSGTESPILALRLMFRALEQQTGVKGRMQHIFSAEIEPFKQAYIERNFSPPILFRDVTELADDEAVTAYGAKVAVPGDVDMLIAGTSCVDYSTLNTKQKGIDAGGESGRTFMGMLKYVERHRPGIVILENVSKAPWDQVVSKFEFVDYDAQVVRLDTKKYYIPHTRTRGYLIAVPKVKKSKGQKSSEMMVEEWVQRIKDAERNASAPTEQFLLDSDDPRIHRARQEVALATQRINADGSQRAAVDWYKCEQRHSVQRQLEKLGLARPLTDWKDGGGKPQMPDGSWQDWVEAQTERVLDLMDISFLRDAVRGTDITYKSAIWNLSQNVDRTTASKVYGITPCLTPNMIPYLTNRGGPLVGLEALALQGLPIDELLLTRENSDQLADLAGNAMTSTVVGSAIMQALIVAGNTLRAAAPDDNEDETMVDPEVTNEDLDGRFRGENRLKEHIVDFASFEPPPADLLDLADRSARKCTCEGPDSLSTHPTATCVKCGHSACSLHQGKPKHVYEPATHERLLPETFESKIKTMLPMRLTVPGFDDASLRSLVAEVLKSGVEVDDVLAEKYLEAVAPALATAEFHFSRVERRRGWSVIFESEGARLELHLEKNLLEWRLFIAPPAELATIDPLRLFLLHPVARMRLIPGSKSLLEGNWEFCIPLKASTAAIEMTFDDFVPSWRAKLQLTDFVDEQRPRYINVTFRGSADALDRSIDGKYVLEDLCGTACNSLYRRCDPQDQDPLYFFFDPSSYLEVEHDSFVFADDCSRVLTHRRLIANLDPKWRPPYSADERTTSRAARAELSIARHWSTVPNARLVAGTDNLAEDNCFSTIASDFRLSISHDDCKYTENLLSAVVKLNKAPSTRWANETFHEVDLHLEGPEVFSKIRWMLSRIPDWEVLQQWSEVDASTISTEVCQTCAPVSPTVKWLREIKPAGSSLRINVLALEDGKEAADYEHALKDRPSPVLLHTRQIGDRFELRIGLNAASLSHAALAQLPHPTLSRWKSSAPKVEWRLANSGTHGSKLGRQGLSATFTIKSNRDSPSTSQPPTFSSFPLRPEQLRSLYWMIEQENDPQPWIEEEVAEYLLPEMNWHAEARASRAMTIRGGVVADAVGYGKTAITIGLICARKEHDSNPAPEQGRIAVKATLIVVPKHLAKQWPKEIDKFTDSGLTVVELQTASQLKQCTVQTIVEADIVIMPESLFGSPVFWSLFTDFAASKTECKFDDKGNRYFRHCVNQALGTLGEQVDRLVKEGAGAAYKKIQEARKHRAAPPTDVFIPTSRKSSNKKAEADHDEADNSEDEDQPKKKAAKGKKKLVDMNEKELKKVLAHRDNKDNKDVKSLGQDEWNFGSKSVAKDWTAMKAPPLAMFSFARIVVDEFTYTSGSVLVGIHHIRARARWVLSGTPPLSDFSEIKSIASLLHCHLGIHDPSEGRDKTVDMRNAEQTSAEKFRSFCDVRSRAWHARRDEIAQRFLDQFARQNIAEIDEIPLETEIINVQLPGAEMAIYRELEHHLYNIDPALAKIAKIKPEKAGDRDRRLREALGKSKTPEEALLKRCSHFTLDLDESELFDSNVESVCEFILRKREHQVMDCREQFKRKIASCAFMHRWIERQDWSDNKKLNATPHFLNTLSVLFNNGYGDRAGNECLREIALSVGCTWDPNNKVAGVTRTAPEDSPKPIAKDVEAILAKKATKETSDEYAVAKVLLLRTASLEVRRLGSELIGRFRSARYFECVRRFVRKMDASRDSKVSQKESDDCSDFAVLSCCGHAGTVDEIKQAVRDGRCIDRDCLAQVSSQYVLDAQALGTDVHSGNFGHKLETLITLIEETPEEDRCLVFVQFDDLFDKVHEALTVYGIPTKVIMGDWRTQSSAIDDFQDVDKKGQKVLLLKATDSSSAGANLTVANWAFFVSPILTDSRAQYKALATQAIGRIHRYGQVKTANVLHLLVPATVDHDTFANLNETPIDSLVKPSRKAIVNPLREKSHEYVPLKRTKDKKEKDEEEAWKKLDLEAAREMESNAELALVNDFERPAEAGNRGDKDRPNSSKRNTKPSRRNSRVYTISHDDETMSDGDSEDSEELVLSDSSAGNADTDIAVIGGDDDDFEMKSGRATSPVAPVARSRRIRARVSYVAQMEESNGETSEEDAEVEAMLTPRTSGKRSNVNPTQNQEEASLLRNNKAATAETATSNKNEGKGNPRGAVASEEEPPVVKKRRLNSSRSSFIGVFVPPAPSFSPVKRTRALSNAATSAVPLNTSTVTSRILTASTDTTSIPPSAATTPAILASIPPASATLASSTSDGSQVAGTNKSRDETAESEEGQPHAGQSSVATESKEASPDDLDSDCVDREQEQEQGTGATTPSDELTDLCAEKQADGAK
ncbi:uncharacterized protein JCM15063_000140 [Sporobolomyces koalae]|uniref:uncharacterized protein n=1 Tax=Sporobolomyces koalae TaxID=500713 RepID=UPI003170AF94